MVSKFGFIFLFCCLLTRVHAQNQSDALNAREQALHALKGFNPSSVLKGYTPNPAESSLQPQEGSNALGAQGLNALKNSSDANEVYHQAQTRSRVRSNSNSPEMRYAEALLENPDSVLDGACYKEAGDCKSQSVTKSCEESVQYEDAACKQTLDVHIKSLTQSFSRVVSPPRSQSIVSFDLQTCPPRDWRCTVANTALLAPSCEKIVVSVTRNGQPVSVTKQPDCADSLVNVQLPRRGINSATLHITVTQYVSEDQWRTADCERIKAAHPNSSCFLESSQSCLEENLVKTVSGVAISRPCWGRALNYLCARVQSSSCTSLINQGCSQTASLCIQIHATRCELYAQTFQCLEQFCLPEKTVCPGKIGCADGQCDTSTPETSDDMAEDISRLGALAGVAGDVSTNQVRKGTPAIFKGKNSTCRKVIANARNCCHGSHQMTHCSQDEKRLAKAKEEGRAAYVGTYCAKKILTCVEEKESWCVFPTKLSSIIQIQGRFHQLGINFGWAGGKENEANCRGITPEELERINFAALDLSPIQHELIARMALPNNGSINNANQSHIERLKQQGRAHD